MPRDWEKSRSELLTELRVLRKERDRLARRASGPPAAGQNEQSGARLDAMYHVSSALANAPSLAEASTTVLGELAACGGWEAGILWLARESGGPLHFMGRWHAPDVGMGELEALSRQATFLPGHDPLGHAWGNAQRPDHYDLRLDGRSPRALYAVEAGLPWASYFPIWHQDRLVGFFEFFSGDKSAPVGEDAKLLAASGLQVVLRGLREFAEQERVEREKGGQPCTL